MGRIRKWVWLAFGFSRTETNAFLVLVPILILSLSLPTLYRYVFPPPKPDFTREVRLLDSLQTVLAKAPGSPEAPSSHSPEVSTRLVAFDPNTATLEELLQLGFTESIARRIINYRNKGGRFQIKRDVLRIYGVDSTTFSRLHPHITLPEALPRETGTHPTQESLTSSFDLNACDSAQLVSVRGIGPVLAARIVKFRSRLGGFVSSGQLYEVYGLDSATVQHVKDRTFVEPQFVPSRINLNTATESELNTHPYLNRNLARAIVAYRKQHGPFQSVDDIKGIKLMDQTTFNKLRPYLDASPEDNQQNRE